MSDTETTSMPAIPLSEQSRILLAIHKSMRVDSGRLLDAVTTLGVDDVERAAALGRAFSAIVTLIHDHHWIEDDVIYPFLIARVAGFEDEAVRLEDDHIDLDAAMARIGARFRLLGHPLSDRVRRDAHRHLVDEAADFVRILNEHLDREEAAVLPVLESLLDEDQHLLAKEESKHSTYHHMRTAVPWVLEHTTPEEEATLRAGAPRLIGFVNDHLWERQFRRMLAPLYDD